MRLSVLTNYTKLHFCNCKTRTCATGFADQFVIAVCIFKNVWRRKRDSNPRADCSSKKFSRLPQCDHFGIPPKKKVQAMWLLLPPLALPPFMHKHCGCYAVWTRVSGLPQLTSLGILHTCIPVAFLHLHKIHMVVRARIELATSTLKVCYSTN